MHTSNLSNQYIRIFNWLLPNPNKDSDWGLWSLSTSQRWTSLLQLSCAFVNGAQKETHCSDYGMSAGLTSPACVILMPDAWLFSSRSALYTADLIPSDACPRCRGPRMLYDPVHKTERLPSCMPKLHSGRMSTRMSTMTRSMTWPALTRTPRLRQAVSSCLLQLMVGFLCV